MILAQMQNDVGTEYVFLSMVTENNWTSVPACIFIMFYFLLLISEGSIFILLMSFITKVNQKKANLSSSSISFVFGHPLPLYILQSSYISTSSRIVFFLPDVSFEGLRGSLKIVRLLFVLSNSLFSTLFVKSFK